MRADKKNLVPRRGKGAGMLIGLRWHEPTLTAIEEWRRAQPDIPSRTEAIRRLVERGLKAKG